MAIKKNKNYLGFEIEEYVKIISMDIKEYYFNNEKLYNLVLGLEFYTNHNKEYKIQDNRSTMYFFSEIKQENISLEWWYNELLKLKDFEWYISC